MAWAADAALVAVAAQWVAIADVELLQLQLAADATMPLLLPVVVAILVPILVVAETGSFPEFVAE